MDVSPVNIEYYVAVSGRCPFEEWLYSLTGQMQHIVDVRLNRLRRGLFGDAKHLGEGVFELRFHVGPGYRVYYGVCERTLILLLEAGDKRSQIADIMTAKHYWEDYLQRRNRK